MNVLAQPTSCCCNFLLLSQKIIFVIGVIDAFKNSEDSRIRTNQNRQKDIWEGLYPSKLESNLTHTVTHTIHNLKQEVRTGRENTYKVLVYSDCVWCV